MVNLVDVNEKRFKTTKWIDMTFMIIFYFLGIPEVHRNSGTHQGKEGQKERHHGKTALRMN